MREREREGCASIERIDLDVEFFFFSFSSFVRVGRK